MREEVLMTRHIIDHRKPQGQASRAKAFLKIEREERPSDATRRLQREPRKQGAGRLLQFLRIEKGQEA